MTNNEPADRSAWAAIVQSYHPIAQIIPPRWLRQTVQANGIRHGYDRTGGDKYGRSRCGRPRGLPTYHSPTHLNEEASWTSASPNKSGPSTTASA